MRTTTAKKERDGCAAEAAIRPCDAATGLVGRGAASMPAPAAHSLLSSPAPSTRRAAMAGTERVAVACDGVIDIAAALFNVSGRELRSPGRSTLAVSRVRQIAMYVAHVTLRLSMRDVGQGFGRDRTTVLHACHQIEDLREDEEFDDIVARVEQVVMAAFGVRAKQG